MKIKHRILVFTFALTALLACKGSDPVAGVIPSDVSATATISNDGSGLVKFEATAMNANTYTFYFGDNDSTHTADGVASHTYAASGNYHVQIIAISTDKHAADFTEDISIVVSTVPASGYSTPDHYDGMTLMWSDEFNGDTLNLKDWNYETGGTGWGNNELEYYQDKNTRVKDGHLIIQARKESVGGRDYTSSRLTTQGKQVFQFGRIDIRAALPKGQGLWPALWMLGSSITTVGWPKCGEMDIMEMIGGTGKDNTVHGTSHWDDGGHQSDTGQSTLAGDAILADQFHVFSAVWNASSITYYLDDVAYHTTNTAPDALSEFRASFFFVFNVAVGGDWPGSPDGSTVFPQQMVVDYVRVFQ